MFKSFKEFVSLREFVATPSNQMTPSQASTTTASGTLQQMKSMPPPSGQSNYQQTLTNAQQIVKNKKANNAVDAVKTALAMDAIAKDSQ